MSVRHTLLILVLLASASSANAHGIAGNRYFVGTLSFDDPAAADEAIVPNYAGLDGAEAPTSMALTCRVEEPTARQGPNGLVKQRFRQRGKPYLHLYLHSSSGGPEMAFQGGRRAGVPCPATM